MLATDLSLLTFMHNGVRPAEHCSQRCYCAHPFMLTEHHSHGLLHSNFDASAFKMTGEAMCSLRTVHTPMACSAVGASGTQTAVVPLQLCQLCTDNEDITILKVDWDQNKQIAKPLGVKVYTPLCTCMFSVHAWYLDMQGVAHQGSEVASPTWTH